MAAAASGSGERRRRAAASSGERRRHRCTRWAPLGRPPLTCAAEATAGRLAAACREGREPAEGGLFIPDSPERAQDIGQEAAMAAGVAGANWGRAWGVSALFGTRPDQPAFLRCPAPVPAPHRAAPTSPAPRAACAASPGGPQRERGRSPSSLPPPPPHPPPPAGSAAGAVDRGRLRRAVVQASRARAAAVPPAPPAHSARLPRQTPAAAAWRPRTCARCTTC